MADYWGQGDLQSWFKKLLTEGLPAELEAKLRSQGEGAIGGRVRTGTQDLKEQFAAKNVSSRAMSKGFSDISSSGAGALSNLYTDIGKMEFGAMGQGAKGMMGMGQLQLQFDKLREFKRQFEEGQSFDFFRDIFGPVLEGGSAALGTYLASDRKLKTNINKLFTIKGINIYSFNYKDSRFGKGLQIGVMADEVEYLGAVIEMPYGKAVNYSIIYNYLR